jgi:hypothetical protein
VAEKLDTNQVVDIRVLLMTEVIQSEALINLLDRKGITKHEIAIKRFRWDISQVGEV